MVIEWKKESLCGVEVIDDQHRQLVNLANQFNQALLKGLGRPSLMNLFIDLADYTAYHFSSEEELMEKYKYPSFVEHKELHKGFKRKLAEYILGMRIGETPMPADVSRYLVDWLNNHLPYNPKGPDASLGIFLRSVGAK
jgi:hemerythrin